MLEQTQSQRCLTLRRKVSTGRPILMHRLRHFSLFAASAFFAAAAIPALNIAAQSAAPSAASSATTVSMPPTPLLPDSFGPWHATGTADNALSFDPAVARELIVQRTDAKTYTADGATAVISAVQMTDSTGAYSGWTLKRAAATGEPLRPCAGGNSLGSNCAVSAGRLLFWEGNTLVLIAPSGTHAVSAGSFSELIGALPKPLGAKGRPPLLPTRLPAAGLLPETERYSVGPATYAAEGGTLPADVLDFAKSPEILTARYTGRGGDGLLTSIFYPTPTIAGVAQHALEKAIADRTLPAGMLSGSPTVRRSGPIVALVTGDFTKAQAEKLANGVKYNAEVTWNKPEGYMDQFTISRTGNVVVQIIILVLTIVAAAAVLGVVFGGGRALIRKARGKPLSSLEDAEIIKLDLRGKPEKLQS